MKIISRFSVTTLGFAFLAGLCFVVLAAYSTNNIIKNNLVVASGIILLVGSATLLLILIKNLLTVQKELKKIIEGDFISQVTIKTPFAEIKEVEKRLRQLKKALLEREKSIKTGKVTEKTLYSVLASLESITQNVHDEIIATDENLRIKFFNRAAEEMFGITQDEVMTQQAGNIIRLEDNSNQPIDVERLLSQVKEKSTEISFNIKEYVYIVRKDGKKIAVTPTISLAKESSGANILVMVFKNISAELEIQKLRDEFVFAAAHELRTPITVINVYMELLNEIRSRLDQETRNYLEAIQRANEKLLNLINDLLDVARAQMDKLKVNLTPVTTKSIVEEAIKQIQPLAEQKKQEILDMSLSAETSPVVMSDPTRLLKILTNLLTNSVKYTPEKGTITIKQEIKNDELLTIVSDTGMGIKPDEQKNVFGKFWRSGDVKEIEGTGLGLFITKQLAEHMEGKIWFASPASYEFRSDDPKNPGTTFYLSLRLSKDIK